MRPVKLEEIDTANESPEYWNSILKSYGLSMERGKRPNLVITIGGLFVLNKVDEKQIARDSGRVIPKGHGPDK